MHQPIDLPDTDRAPLTEYGWDERVAASFLPFLTEARIPARVTRVDRGQYMVASAVGAVRCWPARGQPPPGSEQGPPATGDWIALEHEPGYGFVLAAIVPRRTAISRLDPDGRGEQVLAANVDTVFVVLGLDREASAGRIERFLVLAFESGATPVVVLTKADLADGGEEGEAVAAAVRAVEEVAPGIDVLVVSNETGFGIDDVAVHAGPGRTVALLGQSGVGKSTLLNNLLGEDLQATGETRDIDGRGRHTTTSRELVILPSGGILLDTPGLRTLGLLDADEGVSHTFADIEELAETCRFRDCTHAGEPGCAVNQAVLDGELDGRRLASYRKLTTELEHEAKRADARARRADARLSGRRLRKVRKAREELRGDGG